MILSHSALSVPMPATMMFLPAFTCLLTGASHCTPVTPSSCFFGGFLRVAELTVNSPFGSAIHLTSEDSLVDSQFDSSCLQVHINCLKTDPFRQGCLIYLGHGSSSRCPISAIPAFLTLQRSLSGPFFNTRMALRWLPSSCHLSYNQGSLLRGSREGFLLATFALGLPPLLPRWASLAI